MVSGYQNGTIAQLLQAIIGQINFDGEPISNIGEILLSILEQTPYDDEPKSVLAELFLKLKDKLEGRAFTPYDDEPKSVIAEILLSILNETEYDKEPNSRIAELLLELKAELEGNTEITVSGAIANFNTSLVLPLIGVKSAIVATDIGSGSKTPENPFTVGGFTGVNITRTGKNLYVYDESKVTAGDTTTQSIRSYLNLGLRGGTFTISASLKSGETPTNTNINIAKINASGLVEVITTFILPSSITTRKVTIASNETLILSMSIDRVDVAKANIPKYDIQVEIGNSETTYEAYNGTTHSVSWQTEAGEVFGGEVDVTNGKLVVTHHGFTLTGAEEEGWSISNTGTENYYYVVSLPTGSASAVSGSNVANIFPSVNVANNNTTQGCYNTSSALRVRWGTEMTVANWKTWLSEHNLKVIYKLATPVEYDLADVADIVALKGINNVWNDTNGDTTVTYVAKIEDNLKSTAKFRAEVKEQKEKAKLEKELKELEEKKTIKEPTKKA